MTTTVLFAGGGTAGHVFPALAVARELTRQRPDLQPVFIGTRQRLEGQLVPAAGYELHHIDVLPLPRRVSLGLFKVPGALRSATARCVAIARDLDAAAAVTFGGYVSFPLDWACARLQLPLVVHEQNSIPGLANRFASRWADRVAVSFPGSADRFPRPERTAVTGNPVREELLELDRTPETVADARRHFGLAPATTTLLVFGGSQGARTINEALIGSYTLWDDPAGLQILHAAGAQLHGESASGWERQRARGEGPLNRCLDFIDDMRLAYLAADIVVCRAGATSIAELTALGLPAVLVPYPHATRDHQLHNARSLAMAGAAQVVPDEELTATRLVAAVEPWLADPAERGRVAQASAAFGRREAAENVVHLVLEQLDRAPEPIR